MEIAGIRNSDKIKLIHNFLKSELLLEPKFSITSGSGFSDIWENFEVIQKIQYQNIPGMPLVNIPGHSNTLYLINHEGIPGLVFGGRFHIYEGYSPEIILIPLLVPKLLGVNNFIFMNAAGGLNRYFRLGDLMLINDGINLTKYKTEKIFSTYLLQSPINNKLFDQKWLKETESRLLGSKQQFRNGIYISVNGPNYETPSEIKMFRKLGGDAIGMSTIFESLCGALIGADILAFSVITNSLKEVQTFKVSHKEVVDVLTGSKKKVEQFIRTALDVKFEL